MRQLRVANSKYNDLLRQLFRVFRTSYIVFELLLKRSVFQFRIVAALDGKVDSRFFAAFFLPPNVFHYRSDTAKRELLS